MMNNEEATGQTNREAQHDQHPKDVRDRVTEEFEPTDDDDAGEVGKRHPTVHTGSIPASIQEDATDGTTWRGADELGGDNENHSRKQGIGYGRGTSEESRNDHMYNSTDDDH